MLKSLALSLVAFACVAVAQGEEIQLHPNWEPAKSAGVWYEIYRSKIHPFQAQDGTDVTHMLTIVDANTAELGLKEWIPSEHRWNEASLPGKIDSSNPPKVTFQLPPPVNSTASLVVLYTDYDNLQVVLIKHGEGEDAISIVLILGRQKTLTSEQTQKAFGIVQDRLNIPPDTLHKTEHGVAEEEPATSFGFGDIFNQFQMPWEAFPREQGGSMAKPGSLVDFLPINLGQEEGDEGSTFPAYHTAPRMGFLPQSQSNAQSMLQGLMPDDGQQPISFRTGELPDSFPTRQGSVVLPGFAGNGKPMNFMPSGDGENNGQPRLMLPNMMPSNQTSDSNAPYNLFGNLPQTQQAQPPNLSSLPYQNLPMNGSSQFGPPPMMRNYMPQQNPEQAQLPVSLMSIMNQTREAPTGFPGGPSQGGIPALPAQQSAPVQIPFDMRGGMMPNHPNRGQQMQFPSFAGSQQLPTNYYQSPAANSFFPGFGGEQHRPLRVVNHDEAQPANQGMQFPNAFSAPGGMFQDMNAMPYGNQPNMANVFGPQQQSNYGNMPSLPFPNTGNGGMPDFMRSFMGS